jgi:hypothetical protein
MAWKISLLMIWINYATKRLRIASATERFRKIN